MAENFISDGSFEASRLSCPYTFCKIVLPKSSPWRTSTKVIQVRRTKVAYDGDWWVDLNPRGPQALWQSVRLTSGRYQLSFQLSSMHSCGTRLKTGNFGVLGVLQARFSSGYQRWTRQVLDEIVIENPGVYTVFFKSTTKSACGPALDDVKLLRRGSLEVETSTSTPSGTSTQQTSATSGTSSQPTSAQPATSTQPTILQPETSTQPTSAPSGTSTQPTSVQPATSVPTAIATLSVSTPTETSITASATVSAVPQADNEVLWVPQASPPTKSASGDTAAGSTTRSDYTKTAVIISASALALLGILILVFLVLVRKQRARKQKADEQNVFRKSLIRRMRTPEERNMSPESFPMWGELDEGTLESIDGRRGLNQQWP
ncbi:MAG: hypothetical protein SGCHY_004644 [Lobulomycetales sp.]